MKTNMTKHARYDREKRFEKMIDLIGIGEIVVKCDNEQKPSREMCLTSTGLCIVRTKNNHKIITAYVSSIGTARRIYNRAYGYDELPHGMFETVRANQKYADRINNADKMIFA